MNFLEQSIGKIARDLPGATTVFHKFGLDFCCAGVKNLTTLLAEKGIPHDTVLAELQKLLERGEPVSSWADASNNTLIMHIVERYHDVHREQFPELIRLARRVEDVHGDRPDCPLGLSNHLIAMHEELEEHMTTEETKLFPHIIDEKSTTLSMMDSLQDEHESHGEALNIINHLTNNITTPQGACNTWQALYKGLHSLKLDLMQHIHLENNILFDRVRVKSLKYA